MMTRYVIEVDLTEEDPSEVLDWILEYSGDENASVSLDTYQMVVSRSMVVAYAKRYEERFAGLDEFKDSDGEVIEPYDAYDEARIEIAHMAEEDLADLLRELDGQVLEEGRHTLLDAVEGKLDLKLGKDA